MNKPIPTPKDIQKPAKVEAAIEESPKDPPQKKAKPPFIPRPLSQRPFRSDEIVKLRKGLSLKYPIKQK